MRRERQSLKAIAGLLLVVGGGLMIVPSQATEPSLPPVQLAAADDELAVLAVVLNGQPPEGAAYVVRDRRDGLMVDQATLRRLNLPYSSDRVREFEGRLYVPLSSIQGLVWNILEDRQQLDIRIDPALFPAWSTPLVPPEKKFPSTPDWGLRGGPEGPPYGPLTLATHHSRRPPTIHAGFSCELPPAAARRT